MPLPPGINSIEELQRLMTSQGSQIPSSVPKTNTSSNHGVNNLPQDNNISSSSVDNKIIGTNAHKPKPPKPTGPPPPSAFKNKITTTTTTSVST